MLVKRNIRPVNSTEGEVFLQDRPVLAVEEVFHA